MPPLSPALLDELRALGVDVAGDATLPEVIAALQARIICVVSSPASDFDRQVYDECWRLWRELNDEASADATVERPDSGEDV
jgi:hypothetical protein